MKKSEGKRRFCGNCGNHNAYDYPDRVFCTKRYAKDEDPVVDTLWCCGQWNPSSQECYCVEEATANKQSTE